MRQAVFLGSTWGGSGRYPDRETPFAASGVVVTSAGSGETMSSVTVSVAQAANREEEHEPAVVDLVFALDDVATRSGTRGKNR